jgi:hypothetical protein
MEDREALDPALVREVVANAHGKLARVTELLDQEPRLVNAAWDWGGGDWETPLGAAAHMGRADIVTYLLARGARLDLFAAAMLGKLEVVEAAIKAFPAVRHVAGPHGISLLAHAKAGGEQAMAVAAYLEGLENAGQNK